VWRKKIKNSSTKGWTQLLFHVLIHNMKTQIAKIPKVPEDERSPLIEELLQITHQQSELIQALKDEIARLKGNKPKPKIKKSKLEKDAKENKKKDEGKRAGSEKKSKKNTVEIHETKTVTATNVPHGSRFKGYETYTVQGLVIKPHNICYRRERWVTPDGKNIVAPLPADVKALGGHFNVEIVSFILYQYYHAHVTQPLILEQLLEYGTDISSGEVNNIIVEGHDQFHAEKDEILRVGLEVSSYINVDDTGARHKGKNGYCTHIGNDMFAWFQSTESKSRINFLKLLRGSYTDYVLNDEALAYMRAHNLSKEVLKQFDAKVYQTFPGEAEWISILESLGITKKQTIRIATEGALLGSVAEHGINPDLVVMSDDAGQFNILLHALCWIHAERNIKKICGFTETIQAAIDNTLTQIWDLYQNLKAYKNNPAIETKIELEALFDEIFTQETCSALLNGALQRIHKNKAALLLVLDRPEIPLHNNESERDIREFVKKRKISGSTRSDNGRRCRDTFASLKKTCRKLGVSFWKYLKDRLSGQNNIPQLPELIREVALSPPK